MKNFSQNHNKFSTNTLKEYGLLLDDHTGGNLKKVGIGTEIKKAGSVYKLKSLAGMEISTISTEEFLETLHKTEETLNIKLFN